MILTVSKTAKSSPIFTPGTRPAPPTNPVLIFVIIDPYKLGINITSNCCGRDTSYKEISMIR